MKTQTDVAVIGGGIGGCSTLYHLTVEGITDCVLIERHELTSGTTWHSAAQVTNFGPNQTMIGLKTHSISLYKELADDPDYPINYHHGTGGIRLASTWDHLDGYHHFADMARGMGVAFEVIDAAECARRHPLLNSEGLLGGLWDPLDGDIDPAQLCQALVRRARKAGAEVYRHTPVTGLEPRSDGSWTVRTAKGDIHARSIVNAGGYRCNEIAAMMHTTLPVASMEHQYMVTEAIPDIAALDKRVPLLRCPTDDFYQRAEKDGLLIGFYEQNCRTWGLDGIDPNFTNALCPDDLDRVTDVMEGAIRRLPCLQTAGITRVINGPITYTPDGLPLVGRVPGARNAYCITGLRAGLGEGGGHGWLLAQIIARGEAIFDTWCLDPRRFGDWADIEFTAAKAVEDYQNEFRFDLPHEHRPAGRNRRLTPLTGRLADLGAELAPVNGWERAEFFAPAPGFDPELSFRFSNVDLAVEAEVRAVQTRVGVSEVNGFARLEITGKDAHDWLDGLSCSRISRANGRVSLAYFLTPEGRVKSEATIANIAPDRLWFGSAAAAELHDHEWLRDHLREGTDIEISPLTEAYDILVVAGPLAADVLAEALPDTDWSGFRWLEARTIDAFEAEIVAMSVSFSGETAWELHVPMAAVEAVFEAILAAGAPRGIRPFGLLAAESMRLEKGYRHWKADLITEYTAREAGLDRFIRQDKEFLGKQALEAAGEPSRIFVSLEIGNDTAPAQPGGSVLRDGAVVGTITSAAFGHRTARNLAMAYLDTDAVDDELEVTLCGERAPARVIPHGPYDPRGERLGYSRAPRA